LKEHTELGSETLHGAYWTELGYFAGVGYYLKEVVGRTPHKLLKENA